MEHKISDLDIENKNNIKNIIKKRNIPWLCHFTPIENLESIKKNGLKLRDKQVMKVTDANRADGSDNICLSISEPNKWMYNLKKNKGYKFALLIISPDVLFEKKCFFFPYNAATKSFSSVSKEFFSTAKALDEMFANTVSYQKTNQPVVHINREQHFWDFITTTGQSEVQVAENIEAKYINHIFINNIPLSYSSIITLIGLAISKNKIENVNRINPKILESLNEEYMEAAIKVIKKATRAAHKEIVREAREKARSTREKARAAYMEALKEEALQELKEEARAALKEEAIKALKEEVIETARDARWARDAYMIALKEVTKKEANEAINEVFLEVAKEARELGDTYMVSIQEEFFETKEKRIVAAKEDRIEVTREVREAARKEAIEATIEVIKKTTREALYEDVREIAKKSAKGVAREALKEIAIEADKMIFKYPVDKNKTEKDTEQETKTVNAINHTTLESLRKAVREADKEAIKDKAIEALNEAIKEADKKVDGMAFVRTVDKNKTEKDAEQEIKTVIRISDVLVFVFILIILFFCFL